PIGSRVCGFRYGAGGPGMSGRMLYQRSGMSLSSRRIFLVTAPSLLNPFRRCPSAERVPLPGGLWPPALVPAARRAPADQFESRTRAVGAPRGGLPAPALKLHRPGHREVLLGRRMQRPGGVVVVRPPQGDQVRQAGKDVTVHFEVDVDSNVGDYCDITRHSITYWC